MPVRIRQGAPKLGIKMNLECDEEDEGEYGAPGPSGFFSSLTPEQQKAALEYRGPENHGDQRFTRMKERDRKTSSDFNFHMIQLFNERQKK